MLAPSLSHYPEPSHPTIRPRTPWTGEGGRGSRPSSARPVASLRASRHVYSLAQKAKQEQKKRVLTPAESDIRAGLRVISHPQHGTFCRATPKRPGTKGLSCAEDGREARQADPGAAKPRVMQRMRSHCGCLYVQIYSGKPRVMQRMRSRCGRVCTCKFTAFAFTMAPHRVQRFHRDR